MRSEDTAVDGRNAQIAVVHRVADASLALSILFLYT